MKLAWPILRSLRDIVISSKSLRDLVYAFRNAKVYTDLYSHEIMIADTVRVNSYYEAIKRNIKPGDVILDLGTGTGILSLFAAQQKPKQVYAIDHSEFIHVAGQIAEHNKIGGITFVRANSANLTLAEKIDVLLHEQIGDDLFNEHMVENILDVKRRLLKEDGRILPGKFELFLEPVCLCQAYKIPFLWESNDIHGIDFRFLRNSDGTDKYKGPAYQQRYIETEAVDHFLCEPEPILSFDINELTSEDDLPACIEASKTTIRPGTMDGLCLFFRVIFDDEVSFDTSPLHAKTHWKNRLIRTTSRNYGSGEEISYRITMEDRTYAGTWSLSIK